MRLDSNKTVSFRKTRGDSRPARPGYLGSQDTFYAGTLKGEGGVGRIYQQTFVDTYSK